MISFITLAAVLSVTVVHGKDLAVEDDGCPPWTHRHKSSCECGNTLGHKVVCNGSDVLIEYCLCMTYDNNNLTIVLGYCPYSCIANLKQSEKLVPKEKMELDKAMCGDWNREGQLCSKCMLGYGVPLYSYDFHCVKCKKYQAKELLRFLAAALLPLTLMCIIITLFHINILRPPWSVFVLASQLLSAPPVIQGVYSYGKLYSSSPTYISVLATVLGPWNLDFFRALYKPICISPHISNLHSAIIEGSIGLYPLLLLSLLYIQLKLHDRGCRVVTTLWKPFNLCTSRFRHSLDIRSSLIDSFATFFLLSYMKTGFAVFYILSPTRVWSPDGSYESFLYYDPSVQYFHGFHITYGIVTLLLSLLLHVLPLAVLFFYPFRCFQNCLNNFHLKSLALDAFADAFQGCYKNGTSGTRDCRYFSSLHLLLRAVLLCIYSISQDPTIFLFFSAIVLGIYLTLFVNAKPYKKSVYNTADSLVMIVLHLMILFSLVAIVDYHSYPHLLQACFAYFAFTLVFLVLYMAYWIFARIICVLRPYCKQLHYKGTVLLQ